MTKKTLTRAEMAGVRRAGPGKRESGRFFTLVAYPLSSGEAKFSCAVGVKVSKKAVERNRIKRLCREVMREAAKRIKTPLAITLSAKREALGASYQDVAADIRRLLAGIEH